MANESNIEINPAGQDEKKWQATLGLIGSLREGTKDGQMISPEERFTLSLRAINGLVERISLLETKGKFKEADKIEREYYDDLHFPVIRSLARDVRGEEFLDLGFPSAIEIIKRSPEAEKEVLIFLAHLIPYLMGEHRQPLNTTEVLFFQKLQKEDLGRESTPEILSYKIMIEQVLDHNFGLAEVLDSQASDKDNLRNLLGYAKATSYVRAIRELRQLGLIAPHRRVFYGRLLNELFPKKVKEVFYRLEEIYARINFKDYPLNKELLDYEIALIEKVMPELRKENEEPSLLDIACGTGRHLLGLLKEGRKVVGFDLSPANVSTCHEIGKEMGLEKIPVVVADWFNLPYPEEGFSFGYCLGRSFCHLQTAEDWLSFFENIRKVIKDEGILLIDIPDITKGSYAENIREVKESLEFKGLPEEGKLIFDSPDEYCFDLRSAPSRDQMEALAELMGFAVVRVEERPLGEKGDLNLYYFLQKKETGVINKKRAVQLLNKIDYYSRSNNPYHKFLAWEGEKGLTPAQLSVFGNEEIHPPEATLYRHPNFRFIDLWGEPRVKHR